MKELYKILSLPFVFVFNVLVLYVIFFPITIPTTLVILILFLMGF